MEKSSNLSRRELVLLAPVVGSTFSCFSSFSPAGLPLRLSCSIRGAFDLIPFFDVGCQCDLAGILW
jgi:hypothetical protein